MDPVVPVVDASVVLNTSTTATAESTSAALTRIRSLSAESTAERTTFGGSAWVLPSTTASASTTTASTANTASTWGPASTTSASTTESKFPTCELGDTTACKSLQVCLTHVFDAGICVYLCADTACPFGWTCGAQGFCI